MTGAEPQPLGQAVDRLLRSLGAPAAGTLDHLVKDWTGLTGELLASHSRPVALEHGRLLVAVDASPWATELRFREAVLLARFEDAFGPEIVTRLEIRVAPEI